MKPFPTDLCLILDPDVSPGPSPDGVAEEAFRGGIRMIQYREKQPVHPGTFESVQKILVQSRRHGGLVIINDFVDLALASEADGVHLGQDDLPVRAARSLMGTDLIIGASAHTVEQAIQAQEEGADYLGVGPVFRSPTKQARPPVGLNRLAEIRGKTHIPIFAIGGINMDNVGSVIAAGADGVACISAILRRPDVTSASKEFLTLIHSLKNP
jgi:thiamine-phosphate pyrophosphorylase